MSLNASGRISQASPLPPTLFSAPHNPINRVPSFELDDGPPIREIGRNDEKQWQHLYVLPVLLLEFLALALTRAVLPRLLLERYGTRVYLVLGLAECVRGMLAFVACPIFGKLSDVVGRRLCLFVTVAGTCAPVCVLALLWSEPSSSTNQDTTTIETILSNATTTTMTVLEGESGSATAPVLPVLWNDPSANMSLRPSAINVFVVLLALSGVFASTFTLVFAYISDTVRQREERVTSFGLALATFGLSFTIGPMAGGYLSQVSTHYVFICSLLLTVLDLLYIYFILPESLELEDKEKVNFSSGMSIITMDQHRLSWSPLETMRLVANDPFLRRVGEVAFLYYTGLWAVISTLSLYAVKRFHMGPERLGELMSALGLCTMVAEAVLVRILVPLLGEKRSMRLGLAAFSIQCVVLGLASEGWHLFVCAALSMLGNLVYPSLSSLVSGSVEPEAVGEALGAINGIKALTEGIGPLVFGSLMTLSEGSAMPGWPYLLAALLVWAAYNVAERLPDTEDDYIHEMERKNGSTNRGNGGIILQFLGRPKAVVPGQDQEITCLLDDDDDDDFEEEVDGAMLSEIDESEDGPANNNSPEDLSRLPVTFASLMKQPPSFILKS